MDFISVSLNFIFYFENFELSIKNYVQFIKRSLIVRRTRISMRLKVGLSSGRPTLPFQTPNSKRAKRENASTKGNERDEDRGENQERRAMEKKIEWRKRREKTDYRDASRRQPEIRNRKNDRTESVGFWFLNLW